MSVQKRNIAIVFFQKQNKFGMKYIISNFFRTCFCYESTAPETPKHPYCKTKYSGFCTENDAVLHMFTGYGDGNTTAFLINYSTGKKVPVPPMKVQMAVSQDKNFVPSINFYVVSYKFRATSQSDSTPKEYEVEGCGLANVVSFYKNM